MAQEGGKMYMHQLRRVRIIGFTGRVAQAEAVPKIDKQVTGEASGRGSAVMVPASLSR
jgi:hypothetical protein